LANGLQDYSKSFVRIPKKALPGRDDLPTFARRRLDAEIALVRRGQNAAVERSYSHLFDGGGPQVGLAPFQELPGMGS